MGRRKQYEPNDLLEQARRLFLEQGFARTSISDLEERLGINRKSLYGEFGDKQTLFEAALKLHDAVNVSRRFESLETQDAGVVAIRATIEGLGASARGPAAGRGCLLCNTASERSATDPASRKHVRAYFKRIRAAFQNALTNARAAGDLDPSVDVEAEARFFASHGIGQLTIIRSKAAPDIVEAAAEVALDHLRSLRPG
ncbi:MAG: TetR family transcriptional regulator [Nannocystaceae bacterium]